MQQFLLVRNLPQLIEYSYQGKNTTAMSTCTEPMMEQMGPKIHKFPPVVFGPNDLWRLKQRKAFLVQTLCFLFESISNLQKVMEAELASF